MDYPAGANAYAMREGGEWLLKPICGQESLASGANGVAVRAGGEWVLSSVRAAAAGENSFQVVDPQGGRLLWPIGCAQESDSESACEGVSPYCSSCDCASPIAQSYTVTLSGFPSVCTVQTFNGTWQLTHQDDCVWWHDITEYHRLSLTISSLWLVNWTISASSGPYGNFLPGEAESCAPDTAVWTPNFCYQPSGCTGMRSSYFANATCVVSRG